MEIEQKAHQYYKMESIFNKKYLLLAPYLPEIISIKFGLKTSTVISISNNDNKSLELIEEFCLRTSLHSSYYRRNDECKVFISNVELSVLNDLVCLNENNRLSYPKCCEDNFGNIPIIYTENYSVNGLRWITQNEDANNTLRFEMNPFLRQTPFHLYRHLPCSMQCEGTLDYVSKLLAIIKDTNIELYDAIVCLNRVPVLYLDVCGVGVLFDGIMIPEKGANTIGYRDIYYGYEPRMNISRSSYNTNEDLILFKQIILDLRKGNFAIFHNGKLKIKNKNKLVAIFEQPAHLLWKILDFSG